MKRIFEINLSANFRCDAGYPSRYRFRRDRMTTGDAAWRAVTEFLPANRFDAVLIFVGDAMSFDAHPEIPLPGAWSKAKMKDEIKRLASLGLEAFPMLDLGAARDAWLGETARLISTKRYRETISDLIKETAEVFGAPALFHLGMGDERPGTQLFKLTRRTRRTDVWAEDLGIFSDAARSCGSRPWIWSDRFLEDRQSFEQAVPKDTVLSTQSYGNIKRRTDGNPGFRDELTNSAIELEKLGYDLIVACSAGHSFRSNPASNLDLAYRQLSKPALGILCNQDCCTEDDDVYALKYAAVNFREAYDKTVTGGGKQ